MFPVFLCGTHFSALKTWLNPSHPLGLTPQLGFTENQRWNIAMCLDFLPASDSVSGFPCFPWLWQTQGFLVSKYCRMSLPLWACLLLAFYEKRGAVYGPLRTEPKYPVRLKLTEGSGKPGSMHSPEGMPRHFVCSAGQVKKSQLSLAFCSVGKCLVLCS